ncbi:hypothetical protein IQ268_28675 [Oculatella sp. LEGE 06141]|uniref:hypothetical protein n=1 Tax=Oculatella sp. LEGE 06141 TaxID=1828648 RepID=UPI00187E2C5F|nr:hypothetical protein [Oculatella sp. LEGE 06141]MBE9182529.1 hypothetical protein [Oculatella sp. LEGE 06141]
MFETQATSAFELSVESSAMQHEPLLPPPSKPLSKVLSEVAPTPREGGTNLHPPIWEPAEPQFTKAIAEYYGVSRKSVQEWFQKIKEACPWFPESDLKLADDRYTPMAIHLMGRYRTSGLPFKAWKAQVWEENAELVTAFQASQQSHASQQTEPSATGGGDRPGGMVLHTGSSLALPAIPGIVSPGDDTAYLTQIQQRMQEFESLQQAAIAQMQEQYQQAQALNAQYQEATSLSDQLLLQEFQLKGVQLGYTALQLKQSAFKATIQAAEAGSLPVPGKSQAESGQPPSA